MDKETTQDEQRERIIPHLYCLKIKNKKTESVYNYHSFQNPDYIKIYTLNLILQIFMLHKHHVVVFKSTDYIRIELDEKYKDLTLDMLLPKTFLQGSN